MDTEHTFRIAGYNTRSSTLLTAYSTMLKKLLFAMLAAAALVTTGQAQQGDAAEGRVIAFSCLGCHGIPFQTNVYPTYFVPKIKGQTAGYIEAALLAYREGSRRHATMQAQANTLSDEDIRNVAAYFASLGEDAS
jgi:cytochrome c553